MSGDHVLFLFILFYVLNGCPNIPADEHFTVGDIRTLLFI